MSTLLRDHRLFDPLGKARNSSRLFTDIAIIRESKSVRALFSGILMFGGLFTRMFVQDSFATGVVQPPVRTFDFP